MTKCIDFILNQDVRLTSENLAYDFVYFLS